MEKRFAFRKDLVTSNKPFAVVEREIEKDELSLKNGAEIICSDNRILKHAKDDFMNYLKVSFKILNNINAVKINISITKSGLEDVCDYKGRVIEINDDGIDIKAFDDRGAAQAIYDLEDMMTKNRSPYLKKGKYKNKPLFSPRMVHSGYDLDVFPDGYLQRIVKEGMDAIILFVRDVNKLGCREADINDIIDRADSFGLDTYLYSYLHTPMHPDAEGAEEVYYNTYGKIFESHPGFKGIIFVGESCEFNTTDVRTTQRNHREFLDENNFVDPKPAPGWWPCKDFPRWIDRVKNSVHKAKPDAEIVFWTYNWGWAPKEERIRLLNELPTDITLLVTFEMFQNLPTEYGITERVCDYSVAFAGPGDYFISEAEVAKKRGIKLYAQANAAGRTWDFGVAPYEPFPQQWIERYENMIECHDKYGLSGVMECHHFGFMPSFISEIEKEMFNYYRDTSDNILRSVVDKFSEGQTEECIKAFEYWTKAIRLYMPTDDEQYCAMRVGPAYPLILSIYVKPPKMSDEKVMFQSSITEEYHLISGRSSSEGKFTLHSIRMPAEIRILTDAIKCMNDGLKILKGLKKKNKELNKIINLGEYIVCCFKTDINVKKMYILKTKLMIASTRKQVADIISSIKKLGEVEIKNAEKALKIVDKDSAIGYEPSMGYGGDRAHIEWKIKQVKHMITYDIAVYENGLKF